MNTLRPFSVDIDSSAFPTMKKIRQTLPRPRIRDVASEIRLQARAWINRVSPGQRILITAGSRGLTDNVAILRATVDVIRERGAEPAVLAGMGSHGGGTAEGQMKLLNSLGVTEESVGAPIITSKETASLGSTSSGRQVLFEPMVMEYDGLVVVNRVKPHTLASGHIQSGLMKMLVIGLGRQPGAEAAHRLGPNRLSEVLDESGRLILDKAPVLGGLAVLENGYGETARIVGLPAEDIPEREPELLKEATRLVPGIPCSSSQVLIIEEMGKDFSGTGMDNKVLGRFRAPGQPEPAEPFYSRVVILDLSERSHGNANGMGLADITTYRLFQKIDFPATYLNSLTSGMVQRTMMPVVCDSDRSAIALAIRTCHRNLDDPISVVWIKNTLQLEEMALSPAALEQVPDRSSLEVGEELRLTFDLDGNLKRLG